MRDADSTAKAGHLHSARESALGLLFPQFINITVREGGNPSRQAFARSYRGGDSQHSCSFESHPRANTLARFLLIPLRYISEKVGFEPTIRFHVYTLSKRAP